MARHIASTLFSTLADALTPDKFRDGILELANVVGGNIKALLPEPCRLSLPSQTSNDLLRHYRHLQTVTRVDVPVYSHRFTVTVLNHAAGLCCSRYVEEFATQTQPPSPVIDARLVLPFVDAVRDLFKTMVKVHVTIAKPFFKT